MMTSEAFPPQAHHQETPLTPSTPEEAHRHSKFTASDDVMLRSLVESFGHNDWYAISLRMPGRTARQCKERWMNYLSPTLNTAAWTAEEDQLLLEKQRELGSKWAQIAKFFPNRTDGMVKNRFNRLERRQARVYEVNFKCDATALLWMFRFAPHPPAARAASQKAIEPTPIPEPTAIEFPASTDPDFDSWNDPIDIDFFEV
jgi:hypothetical protein